MSVMTPPKRTGKPETRRAELPLANLSEIRGAKGPRSARAAEAIMNFEVRYISEEMMLAEARSLGWLDPEYDYDG